MLFATGSRALAMMLDQRVPFEGVQLTPYQLVVARPEPTARGASLTRPHRGLRRASGVAQVPQGDGGGRRTRQIVTDRYDGDASAVWVPQDAAARRRLAELRVRHV